MVHLTNGDSTVPSIEQSGIPGPVVPWRDVLHEGPVPGGLSWSELTERRAEFLAGGDPAMLDRIRSGFAERDEFLRSIRSGEEVVLWFEHDLYDQLQILQILHWFAREAESNPGLLLICIDRFPGVEPFYGLGQLSSGQIGTLFPFRVPLTPGDVEAGSRLWLQFAGADPAALEVSSRSIPAAFPFLPAALRRLFEQYPSVQDGLGRTERQILHGVAAGLERPIELFLYDQKQEEYPFMGDDTYWTYLERLTSGPEPALEITHRSEDFTRNRYALTAMGQEVLEGRTDYVAANGIDRWFGGVHLIGRDPAWRWDRAEGHLVRR